jgi:hypothetical protein
MEVSGTQAPTIGVAKLFQLSGELIAQEAELLRVSQCILEKAPIDRFSQLLEAFSDDTKPRG